MDRIENGQQRIIRMRNGQNVKWRVGNGQQMEINDMENEQQNMERKGNGIGWDI